jgi:outer membrane lipoprotein-sorting protein
MRLFKPALTLMLALACTAGSQSAAYAADAQAEVLARMDQAAATFRSLSANIRKVAHVEVINENTVDTGTILVKRFKPRDIRYFIDIESPPNPKKVLLAGHIVTIYYPAAKRVEEYDLGKNRSAVEQFLLLGFGSNSKDLESAYSIKLGGPEMVEGQKTTRIELIPKAKEVLENLTKVELWIGDAQGVAVQQKFYQQGGDYSLATYTNIKINPPNISDSSFRLDLPRDVQRQRPQK